MSANKNFRAWFFSNEALTGFLSTLPGKEEIKKVYGIAGGGDFSFNFLAESNRVEEMVLCDIRPVAVATINNKISLFSKTSFNEVNKLLVSKDWQNSLKKTNFWYSDSFLPLTRKADYLAYLTSEEKFESLKKQFDKIEILEGDFLEQLRAFDNGYFDLIYSSDIFDHESCCLLSEENLKLIKNKMSEKGLLLIVTQNQPQKVIKEFEANGFRLKTSELHSFNIFKAFWRYDYSFLLFEKI